MQKNLFLRHKKLFIMLIAVAAILLVTLIAGTVYLGSYYRADADAIAAFSFGSDVRVERDGDDLIFHPAGTPRAGVIFYPPA